MAIPVPGAPIRPLKEICEGLWSNCRGPRNARHLRQDEQFVGWIAVKKLIHLNCLFQFFLRPVSLNHPSRLHIAIVHQMWEMHEIRDALSDCDTSQSHAYPSEYTLNQELFRRHP
jgi:hypothetical protein